VPDYNEEVGKYRQSDTAGILGITNLSHCKQQVLQHEGINKEKNIQSIQSLAGNVGNMSAMCQNVANFGPTCVLVPTQKLP
jgi:hypothetical protein